MPRFALAFQYAAGLIGEERNQGRTIDFNPAKTTTIAGMYWGVLIDYKGAFDPKDKVAAAMYVSSLMARGEVMDARSAAKETLVLFPSYYQMRLMYAQTLLHGIVAYGEGNNKWQRAPAGMSADPTLAYKQALQVTKEAPHFVQAYYVAGYLATTQDKTRAARYLLYFIEHSTDSARKETARKLLESLR